MINWNNLDTLTSFKELSEVERVNLAEVMSGANGAKAVDDKVLAALAKLAKEAQLTEKYAALYNGEVINTGEKRLVLHQLTRGQLGDKVEADGVDKREFYVKQQQRIADFANKVHAGEITNAAGEKFTTVVLAQCILHLRTGLRRTAHSRWKPNSSAMLTRMMQ